MSRIGRIELSSYRKSIVTIENLGAVDGVLVDNDTNTAYLEFSLGDSVNTKTTLEVIGINADDSEERGTILKTHRFLGFDTTLLKGLTLSFFYRGLSIIRYK